MTQSNINSLIELTLNNNNEIQELRKEIKFLHEYIADMQLEYNRVANIIINYETEEALNLEGGYGGTK